MSRVRAGKSYIEQEYRTVQKKYKDLSLEELAKRLKRTKDGVREFIKNMEEGLVEWSEKRNQVKLKEELKDYIAKKDWSIRKLADSTGVASGTIKTIQFLRDHPEIARNRQRYRGGDIKKRINSFYSRTSKDESLDHRIRWLLESSQVRGMLGRRKMGKKKVMARLDLSRELLISRYRIGELIFESDLEPYDFVNTENAESYEEARPLVRQKPFLVLAGALLRTGTKTVKNDKNIIVSNKVIKDPLPSNIITMYLEDFVNNDWRIGKARREMDKMGRVLEL